MFFFLLKKLIVKVGVVIVPAWMSWLLIVGLTPTALIVGFAWGWVAVPASNLRIILLRAVLDIGVVQVLLVYTYHAVFTDVVRGVDEDVVVLVAQVAVACDALGSGRRRVVAVVDAVEQVVHEVRRHVLIGAWTTKRHDAVDKVHYPYFFF